MAPPRTRRYLRSTVEPISDRPTKKRVHRQSEEQLCKKCSICLLFLVVIITAILSALCLMFAYFATGSLDFYTMGGLGLGFASVMLLYYIGWGIYRCVLRTKLRNLNLKQRHEQSTNDTNFKEINYVSRLLAKVMLRAYLDEATQYKEQQSQFWLEYLFRQEKIKQRQNILKWSRTKSDITDDSELHFEALAYYCVAAEEDRIQPSHGKTVLQQIREDHSRMVALGIPIEEEENLWTDLFPRTDCSCRLVFHPRDFPCLDDDLDNWMTCFFQKCCGEKKREADDEISLMEYATPTTSVPALFTHPLDNTAKISNNNNKDFYLGQKP